LTELPADFSDSAISMKTKLSRTVSAKRYRKRLIRYGLLAGNLLIVVVAALFVLHNPNSQAIRRSVTSESNTQAVNPLDKLSAADIAVSAAKMANLPETVEVTMLADTVRADLNSAAVEDIIVYKPQIPSSKVKTKADIQTYTVANGDTLGALATKFGVTSDSIKWSNSLVGTGLRPGTALTIPPVDGIAYTVKSGDTVDTLASKYSANKNTILAFNDAEISGLKVGEKIVIPGGSITVAAAPAVGRVSFSYGGGGTCFYNGAAYSNFGYSCGFCTWYAAFRGGAPNGWGNASSWAYWARVTPGWAVSKTPRPGAIAQTTSMSYLGHVGIVEQVSEDGNQIIYSDMNGIRGFGAVGTSGWVSASTFQNYIYRQ
jgi:LysM repeat protein